MKETDNELLKIYMQGFKDELNGKQTVQQPNLLSKKPYSLGRLDALLGDELHDSVLQTNEQILNRIYSL